MCSLINVSSLNFFTTMSKRSLFWGHASGKLGEAVFYRAGGEQRTRAYVKAVKNPKTLAQMMQRITMGNLVSMYSALKPILSQSFPLRPTNRSAFNEFVSANKGAQSYAVTKDDVRNRYFWPVDLTISRGNLNIPTELTFDAGGDEESYPCAPWRFLARPVLATELGIDVTDYVGGDAVDMRYKKLTPYQLYKLFTANGNPYGLPEKFVITIYVGSLDAGVAEGSDANGLMSASYVQYICSSVESECQFIKVGNDMVCSGATIAVYEAEPTSDNNDVQIYSLVAGYGLRFSKMALGVIVSCKQDSVLKVTTSKVYGDAQVAETSASCLPGGENYNIALNDYGYNPDSILA